MAVITKQKGAAKKETATIKKEVQKKLAQETTGKTTIVPPIRKTKSSTNRSTCYQFR